jgi:hypothetical protein
MADHLGESGTLYADRTVPTLATRIALAKALGVTESKLF